jgi:anaerobic ribonucleoside-triphosphate reductase activating protein
MSESLMTVRPQDEVSLTRIKEVAGRLKGRVDGVTISGGEPFEQATELADLVEYLHAELSPDIIVYSGYTLAELREFNDPDVERVLSSIGVLIDGRYNTELDDGVGIRGSSNQRIWRLNPAISIEGYADSPRQVETFVFGDQVLVAGLM